MSVVHDFSESLAASHRASDLPIWQEIYRQAFPNMVACIDHRDDGEHQRAGIDRSVILSNSKQVLIDEKIRYKDYGDILLEYLSNDRRNTPRPDGARRNTRLAPDPPVSSTAQPTKNRPKAVASRSYTPPGLPVVG